MATKKQSGYVVPLQSTIDKGGLNCGNCYYFDSSKNRCSIVKGHIDTFASCNLWSRNGQLNLRFVSGQEALSKLKQHKITKTDAGYTDARHTINIVPSNKHKGIRCDSCLNFIDLHTPIGKCKGVEGKINRNACCNLWTDKPNPRIEYSSGKTISNIIDIEDLYISKN